MRPAALLRTLVPVALLAAATALAGCAQEGGAAGFLRSAGVGTATPDEFMVLPTRPLEVPADMATLPPPTPGAPNRVDVQPRTEAVAALTGRTQPAEVSGAVLVARAGPVDPNIRGTVALEAATFRQDNRGLLFERWFSRNLEAVIYDDVILDAAAEYQRLRAAGVAVPPAPPELLSAD
jgi:hypothetical protein